jgi:hypothetical protein
LPTVSPPDWLLPRVFEAMLMLLLHMLLLMTIGVEESVAQFLLELAEHCYIHRKENLVKNCYEVYSTIHNNKCSSTTKNSFPSKA